MSKLLYIPEGRICTFQRTKTGSGHDRVAKIEEGYFYYEIGGTIEEFIQYLIKLKANSGFKEKNNLPELLLREELEVINDEE